MTLPNGLHIFGMLDAGKVLQPTSQNLSRIKPCKGSQDFSRLDLHPSPAVCWEKDVVMISHISKACVISLALVAKARGT